MLDYVTIHPGVQTVLLLMLGAIAIVFAIGFNVRRGMLAGDTEKQHDHERKIEMMNIERLQLIDGRKAEDIG